MESLYGDPSAEAARYTSLKHHRRNRAMFMAFSVSSFGLNDGLLPDAVIPLHEMARSVLSALIGRNKTHGVGRSHYGSPLTILRAVIFI
jgi:hypothetical protein